MAHISTKHGFSAPWHALDTSYSQLVDRPDPARKLIGPATGKIMGMTWKVPAPEPVDGPLSGDDRPILEGYLAWQRSTLLHICAGLTAEQLAARPAPPSTLSLLGLIRHLAKVERIWLRQRAAGQPIPPLYGGAGDDTDFTEIRAQDAEEEVAQLREEWQQADQAVAGLPFTTRSTSAVR